MSLDGHLVEARLSPKPVSYTYIFAVLIAKYVLDSANIRRMVVKTAVSHLI